MNNRKPDKTIYAEDLPYFGTSRSSDGPMDAAFGYIKKAGGNNRSWLPRPRRQGHLDDRI